MFARLESLVSALREEVARLDPGGVSGSDASRLTELYAEAERLAAAGRVLAAGRVASSAAWMSTGASSPAAWLAAQMGSTIGRAGACLEAAHALDSAPLARSEFVAGRLSEPQAAEIAVATVADPASEQALVDLAGRASFVELRERCRDVAAAAAGDEGASERIRRSRYFRHWCERDGAVRLDARLAPEDAAPLIAVVNFRADRFSREARSAGQIEPRQAHMADALCSLADGAGAPKAVVSVHVSAEALARGHTVAGETCRIQGVGPAGVGAVGQMAATGAVRILQTDGVDVGRIAHVRRGIPAHLRSALEVRDPCCVVPGCSRRHGLEIDHIQAVSEGGPTRLDNLARLCRWHHARKTYGGWILGGSPGAWTWTPGPARGP